MHYCYYYFLIYFYYYRIRNVPDDAGTLPLQYAGLPVPPVRILAPAAFVVQRLIDSIAHIAFSIE